MFQICGVGSYTVPDSVALIQLTSGIAMVGPVEVQPVAEF